MIFPILSGVYQPAYRAYLPMSHEPKFESTETTNILFLKEHSLEQSA